jgi:hypothetical protein
MLRQPAGSSSTQPETSISIGTGTGTGNGPNDSPITMMNASRQIALDGTFNDLFDYASFMWDNEPQNGMIAPTRWRDLGFHDMDMDSLNQRDDMVSFWVYT